MNSGVVVTMGSRQMEGQTVDEILDYFGKKENSARN